MPRDQALRHAVLAFGLALLGTACATTPWPDEPGKPVPVSQAANVEAGEQFMTALTAARAARGLPPPVVAPRYQTELRNFADDLQSGRASAAGVLRAIHTWGRVTYQAGVDAWVLDCTGRTPEPPSALVSIPTAVVSYTGASFRPQSATADQCAVLVVSPRVQ